MQQFIEKHAEHVIGVLSGFDRLVFRGTLRMLAHRGGLMNYLSAAQVLLKDFADHTQKLTEQLKDASLALARETGRPVRYLASAAASKEDIAREIARADKIEQGLVCVLSGPSEGRRYGAAAERRSAARPMPDWWIGGIEIVLGAAAVILTAVALGVGVLAIWGYRDIKTAAVEVARKEGREAAEKVAAREIRAYLDKVAGGEDISAAYRDEPS